jgi:hypothetical protein
MKRIVRQVGYLLELYRDTWLPEYKILLKCWYLSTQHHIPNHNLVVSSIQKRWLWFISSVAARTITQQFNQSTSITHEQMLFA